MMEIRVEFAGGTELLFDKAKFLNVKLDEDNQGWTISRLIRHLSEKYIKERVELFSVGDKIRPGILILVNDVDYEILGGYDYKLKPTDKVLFISTLHGG
jgi:ubiquitin related modifier 1